ncbi:MAG: hypothetical protein Q8867_07915 [Bacteroidota bacterium]|nr:hypothetical protein [Bacteroidota bacterium]
MRKRTLYSTVVKKASLKQEVYIKTYDAFERFRKETLDLSTGYQQQNRKMKFPVPFEFTDGGQFWFELKFGSDILIFFMHSNVFELPRDHEVMKTSYIKENKTRSYCGIIHIFNFLADSFKYDRINDVGYLIGRVFINRENHYFIEGKHEIGLLYNNFNTARLNHTAIQSIIHSSILYTVNFDLLTPPFDNIKEVSMQDMKTVMDAMQIRTGKRLGFRFQADKVENGKRE